MTDPEPRWDFPRRRIVAAAVPLKRRDASGGTMMSIAGGIDPKESLSNRGAIARDGQGV